jgi:hypothetical protein
VRLSIVSSASSAGSSGSGTENDSIEGNQTPLLALKRTCPTPADSASRRAKNRRLTRNKNTAQRQMLSPPKKNAGLSRPLDAGSFSDEQSRDTEVQFSKDSSDGSDERSVDPGRRRLRIWSRPIERKPMASRPVACSQSNTKNSSSIHALPQADGKTRHTRSIAAGTTEWYASNVTFHSLSTDMSFLTALFRTRSGPGFLSTSCAASVLKNHLGRVGRLSDITIKLLTPDTWFFDDFRSIRLWCSCTRDRTAHVYFS